jgi:hypothetical protein
LSGADGNSLFRKERQRPLADAAGDHHAGPPVRAASAEKVLGRAAAEQPCAS